MPAGAAAWQEIEDWAGCVLPEDYKEFTDEYGDGCIMTYLIVGHPSGSTPLLDSMKAGKILLARLADQYRGDPNWSSFDPTVAFAWGYHNYDGDFCFLVPRENREWAVLLTFRHHSNVLIAEGGFTSFMINLLKNERVPTGWPLVEPVWESVEDSPLI
jgi:hypothetical protein